MEESDFMQRLKTTGRNDPCPCGSGKKYKKCHLREDEAKQHEELQRQAEIRAEEEAKADAEDAENSSDENTHKKQHQPHDFKGPSNSSKGRKVRPTQNLPRRGPI